MFTVKKFLALPAFHEFEVIAGNQGLNNIISSVNIMDNPDALDWFSPGELLLTSGYFFKDSSQVQNRVVTQLENINCPALCIKPHQYLGIIPQNIILLADQFNLPVIKLPYGMSFSKIADIIRGEISDNYDIINRESLDIHKAFFDISLQGGGISKISQSLSEMISNPVIFMDKYFNIIDLYDMEENPYPIKNIFNGNLDKNILNEDYINSLPPNFEQLQKPLARRLHINNQAIDTVITSVYIQNIHYGYILVWKTIKELSNIDYITLEHSTMSFALERIRTNEVTRTKNRVRRDFLHDIFLGKITDIENMRYLCDIHRINMELSYVPMILNLDFLGYEGCDFIEKKKYEDTKILEVLNFLDKSNNNSEYIIHSLSIQSQIIILIGFDKEKVNANIESTKLFCSETIRTLENNLDGIKIYAGIGGISNHLIDLHHYYNQAMEALRLARKSPGNNRVRHFNDFIVHHFLENNIDEIKMRKFFDHSLGSLYKYDKENDAELLETLETWIESNYNIAKTSRQLFTHRNTILYRIDRISDILNTDLEDPNELLKFHLALKIFRLLEI